jgi:hypothetical protein
MMAIASAVILMALGLIYLEMFGGPHHSQRLENSAFFSDDDGATWFIDDNTKIPPFDRGGKPAYRAEVFECGTGKPFVAYLEKFTAAKKQQIQAELADHPENLPALLQTPTEIKKPGDAKWLSPDAPGGSAESKAYTRVLTQICPQGTTALTHVMPSDQETGASP